MNNPYHIIKAILPDENTQSILTAYKGEATEPVAQTTTPEQTEEKKVKFKTIWNDLRTFTGLVTETPYLKYLLKRGISLDEIIDYEIKYAVDGRYAGRVILPVKTPYCEVVTFVARSIIKNDDLRYSNCPVEDSILSVEHCLYGIERMVSMDMGYIVIVEGIFDALKLLTNRVPAVAVFKKKMTDAQRLLLAENISKNTTIFVMLDEDVVDSEVDNFMSGITPYFSKVYQVSINRKDAGILSKEEVEIFQNQIQNFLGKGEVEC